METETSVIILDKIVRLASQRQQPFIVLRNPKREAVEKGAVNDGNEWIFAWLATIGPVTVGFDSFYPSDMIDLYSELKAALYAEEAVRASNMDNPAYAKST